jgi:hypothetical protein
MPFKARWSAPTSPTPVSGSRALRSPPATRAASAAARRIGPTIARAN